MVEREDHSLQVAGVLSGNNEHRGSILARASWLTGFWKLRNFTKHPVPGLNEALRTSGVVRDLPLGGLPVTRLTGTGPAPHNYPDVVRDQHAVSYSNARPIDYAGGILSLLEKDLPDGLDVVISIRSVGSRKRLRKELGVNVWTSPDPELLPKQWLIQEPWNYAPAYSASRVTWLVSRHNPRVFHPPFDKTAARILEHIRAWQAGVT